MTETFLIMMVAGLAIGLLAGMVGVGGGTLMIPLFRVIFDLSPIVSTATSLFTIIPTSISGAIGHARNRTFIPKLGLAMGLAGACTSPVGVWFAHLSPGWVVMIAAAAAIAYSATDMMIKAMRTGKGAGANGKSAGAITADQVSLERGDYLKGAIIGAVAGLLSGYIGLGGGFLMIPLMLTFLHLPMKLAAGTSLIAIMLLAIPGTIEQGILGNIDYFAGIAVACGSIPGALLGARLNRHVPERALRLIFAAFLGVAAITMVAKEFM